MKESKYFSTKELACKGTGEVKLANGFLRQLDELRVAYGEPMVVNSCCRSSAYNKKVGGNPHRVQPASLSPIEHEVRKTRDAIKAVDFDIFSAPKLPSLADISHFLSLKNFFCKNRKRC